LQFDRNMNKIWKEDMYRKYHNFANQSVYWINKNFIHKNIEVQFFLNKNILTNHIWTIRPINQYDCSIFSPSEITERFLALLTQGLRGHYILHELKIAVFWKFFLKKRIK